MSDAASMQAFAVTSFGDPPAVIEVPAPEVGPGEVLVRVRAASVNPYDAFVALGAMQEYMEYVFPAVLGMDVAGVVEGVGEGVEGFAPGDRVFGTLGMKGVIHDGTFGELATPQAPSIARTQDGLDDAAAATLGVAGTTAMTAITVLDPAEGATIVVVGATGGVGTFAVQLAAARGAHVIASVRPGDEGFVTELGAAETVDYTGDLAADVRDRYPHGVDGLIDLVNRDPSVFADLAALVREGGRAASALGGAGEVTEIGGVSVANVGSDPSHLAELASMVVDGRLRPAVRRTYPLADAARALAGLTDRAHVGQARDRDGVTALEPRERHQRGERVEQEHQRERVGSEPHAADRETLRDRDEEQHRGEQDRAADVLVRGLARVRAFCEGGRCLGVQPLRLFEVRVREAGHVARPRRRRGSSKGSVPSHAWKASR